MKPGDLRMIVDFEGRFAGHPQFRSFTQRDFVEYVLYRYNETALIKVVIGDPKRAVPSTAMMHDDRGERPEGLAIAYVNPLQQEIAPVPVGRWIVNCPFCARGTEYVDFRTGLFMCCACWNGAIGNQWLQIKLPAPGLRRNVERLLLLREPENRHWRPFETIEEVRMENIKRGVPV